jgi:hypothetical protein
MGMVMYWIPVSGPEAAAAADGALDPWDLMETPGRTIDVDKAWHGVHTVLTGRPDEDDTPIGRTVFGGSEIGDDDGYGPPRLLTDAQVREVSDALDALGPGGFDARIDLDALARQSVYPLGWDRADEAHELRTWLVESYDTVAGAYRDAAKRGDAMLIICA